MQVVLNGHLPQSFAELRTAFCNNLFYPGKFFYMEGVCPLCRCNGRFVHQKQKPLLRVYIDPSWYVCNDVFFKQACNALPLLYPVSVAISSTVNPSDSKLLMVFSSTWGKHSLSLQSARCASTPVITCEPISTDVCIE